jgi:hypothetical protein
MNGRLSILFASLCLLSSMPLSAARDVLEEPVSLRAEADLIKAVALTLQHAITTSEQFQGSNPALRKFADREIKKNRSRLLKLSKRVPENIPPVRQLAIAPDNEQSYVRAMLRNHARLLELIEHGSGLPLSADIKRAMEALSSNANAERTFLYTMEKS